MQKYYKVYFDVTSRHKKRQKNDMQPEFSYAHWLREAPKSSHVKVDQEKYKYELVKGGPVAYISYRNDMKKNKPAIDRQIKSKTTKVGENRTQTRPKPDSNQTQTKPKPSPNQAQTRPKADSNQAQTRPKPSNSI